MWVRTFFTKKMQSAEETTEEIMDIANICRSNGIERIFVTSITYRPNYRTKVDEVNNYYAAIYKFVYIDNSCIKYVCINRIRMFVCLSVGYTLLIKPNSIHMLYMGRSGIYRGRFLSKNYSIPTTLLRL